MVWHAKAASRPARCLPCHARIGSPTKRTWGQLPPGNWAAMASEKLNAKLMPPTLMANAGKREREEGHQSVQSVHPPG